MTSEKVVSEEEKKKSNEIIGDKEQRMRLKIDRLPKKTKIVVHSRV